MNSSWSEKAFEECLERVEYTPKINRSNFLTEGLFPIISQEADFTNGYWNNDADVFHVDGAVIVFGDHTKVIKFVDFDFVLGAEGVKILKPCSFLDAKFFYYFLKSCPLSDLGYARHYRILKQLRVRFPSLPEQRRIVTILEEAFARLEMMQINAEKSLQNCHAIFSSMCDKIFHETKLNFNETALDNTCIVERGSSPRPIKKYITSDADGVNWIKIGDAIEGDKYIYKTAQKITPEGAKKSRYVKGGDFILTNSMSFGRPYIMKTDGFIHDGWFVLRLKETINADYFYYLLSSNYVQSQFSRLASGAIVLNISSDLVKKAMLPIPPIENQELIAKRLDILSDEIEKITAIYERKSSKISELQAAILSSAFSGELTSSDATA